MAGESRKEGKTIPVLRSCLIAALAFVFLTGGCAHSHKQAPPPVSSAPAALTRITADPSASQSVAVVTAAPDPESGSSARPKDNPVTAAANPGPDTSPSAAPPVGPDTQADTGEASGEADEGLEDDFIADDDEGEADSAAGPREESLTIADPWEPFNRAMYHFNDKLYFWVIKPVAQGYAKVLPEGVRISIRNVFVNIAFPVRFVNCVLQLDLPCAAVETGRFVINSVWGLGGLFDLASDEAINLPKQRRDLGQTLGVHGIGPGFFINWPVLGPSSPRDTIGLAGDILMDPLAWVPPWYAATSITAGYKLNETSLGIGDYEALKEAAIDPYVAIRDAYVQYRYHKIKQVTDRK